MRFPIFGLLLALVVSFSNCKKDDSKNYQLLITLPTANTGERVGFNIKNGDSEITGVRWDPGDGTLPYSTPYDWATSHTYNTPGDYTITATVFRDNESIALTAPISVVGQAIVDTTDTTSNTDTTTYLQSIRITEIELVEFIYITNDAGFYNNNFQHPNARSDIYFKVSNKQYGRSLSVIYPRSQVLRDTTAYVWSLGTDIPIIGYDRLDYINIDFYDDNTVEGAGDYYIEEFRILGNEIRSYLASKPSTIQLSDNDIVMNLTIEWID